MEKKNLEKVFITVLVRSNKSRRSIILKREPFPEKVTFRHVKLKYHDRWTKTDKFQVNGFLQTSLP